MPSLASRSPDVRFRPPRFMRQACGNRSVARYRERATNRRLSNRDYSVTTNALITLLYLESNAAFPPNCLTQLAPWLKPRRQFSRFSNHIRGHEFGALPNMATTCGGIATRRAPVAPRLGNARPPGRSARRPGTPARDRDPSAPAAAQALRRPHP